MSAPFAAEAAAYLADCTRHAGLLSPAYHPTEPGALKVIWHRGEEQEAQIRAAFRAAAGGGRHRPACQRAQGRDAARLTAEEGALELR